MILLYLINQIYLLIDHIHYLVIFIILETNMENSMNSNSKTINSCACIIQFYFNIKTNNQMLCLQSCYLFMLIKQLILGYCTRLIK